MISDFIHNVPFAEYSLEWRHNGRDCVSNHQPHDCLLNRLFRHRSKKTSKLRVTGLCAGNSPFTWWRHQIETFYASLAICARNSPVTGEFHTHRPVTRSFDVFFDLRLNKCWVYNGEAGDIRRHRAHYDVTNDLKNRQAMVCKFGILWHNLACVYNFSKWQHIKPPILTPPIIYAGHFNVQQNT